MFGLAPKDSFFQDLFDFRRDFDQIFNRILLGKPLIEEQHTLGTLFDFLPAIETYIDKDSKKFICRVSLPGLEPKDVDIQANGNLLTIKGERKAGRTSAGVDLMNDEIVYGKFERTFSLPEGVLADKLAAEYRSGMLEITAPVAMAALPRKVEIKVVPISKQVAA